MTDLTTPNRPELTVESAVKLLEELGAGMNKALASMDLAFEKVQTFAGEVGNEELIQSCANMSRSYHALASAAAGLAQYTQRVGFSGTQPPDLMDLAEIVGSICSTVNPLIRSRRVHIEFSCDHHDPYAVVVPELVEQMVTALLSNAVKYSLPGGIVKVALSRGRSGTVITVTDQGRGMTSETMNTAFSGTPVRSPFDPNNGVGLGLYAAWNIANSMGGGLLLGSNGGGTVFTLRLPRPSGELMHQEPKPYKARMDGILTGMWQVLDIEAFTHRYSD